MSNKPYKGFEPNWLLTPAPENSYRSIFRWGDPNFFKYPKESLYTLMKEKFQMTDDDFKAYSDDTGFDPVELPDHPVQLASEHIEALKAIVGEQNLSTTDYDRLSVAYGATAYDLLRLRHKRIDSVPDVVLYPETSEQVEQIVAYSTEHHIPLYVYGGGSSVTRGVEPTKAASRWICAATSTRSSASTRSTRPSPCRPACPVRIWKRRCRTRPNSSAPSVSTPAATSRSRSSIRASAAGPSRAAPGQNSTYYGTIADIVLSQKYATPIGVIQTSHYSREATGRT